MRPRNSRDAALEGLRCECSALWLDRVTYERAETLYHVQQLRRQNAATSDRPENRRKSRSETPSSLPLQPRDEGYQSQTPTPPTPAPRPINGLPGLPPPLMGVWLQKPAFDRAEATFYKNRCRTLAPPRQTGSAHGERNGKKMAALECLALDRIWFEKSRYDEAERQFYERNIITTKAQKDTGANSILKDIAKARENIQKSLAGLKTNPQPHRGPSPKPSNPSPSVAPDDHSDLLRRVKELEQQNAGLQRVVEELRSSLSEMEVRVSALEQRPPAAAVNGTSRHHEEEEDEEELDLFGSDEEEDEEAERIKQQRLQEYTARKAKKPTLIAKSSILLDVKPWDDETDMAQLEVCVRSLRVDGLLWGASRLVPVGYGIKKLQISCVVEDDKVGTDFLEEEITKFEEHVQSVDVAAFNKI